MSPQSDVSRFRIAPVPMLLVEHLYCTQKKLELGMEGMFTGTYK